MAGKDREKGEREVESLGWRERKIALRSPRLPTAIGHGQLCEEEALREKSKNMQRHHLITLDLRLLASCSAAGSEVTAFPSYHLIFFSEFILSSLTLTE